MELIKKDEVIYIIKKLNRFEGFNIGNNEFEGDFYCRTSDLIVTIKELYPTKVLYRKGKWIVSKEDSNFNCSICGCNPRKDFRASSLEWIREINGCDMQYCPWCGAKMGGYE